MKSIKMNAALIWLLLPSQIIAQCLGDDCTDPQILIAPALDQVACAETVCNGSWPEWNCSDEDQGEPGTCWSQEYDYFVQLQVYEEGFYYLYLTSDYQAPPTAPDDVQGGIQMAIYNGTLLCVARHSRDFQSCTDFRAVLHIASVMVSCFV